MLSSSGTVGQATGVGGTGNAASFDGTAYLYANTSRTVPRWDYAGGDFTLSGWFYFNTTGLCTLMSIGDSLILGTYSNRIRARLFYPTVTSEANDYVDCNYTQAATTWIHVCYRYDAATRVHGLRINNGTEATATLPGAAILVGPSECLTIGANNGAGFGNLTGRAAHVLFATSAPGRGGRLTDAQIALLYGSGAPPAWPIAGIG